LSESCGLDYGKFEQALALSDHMLTLADNLANPNGAVSIRLRRQIHAVALRRSIRGGDFGRAAWVDKAGDALPDDMAVAAITECWSLFSKLELTPNEIKRAIQLAKHTRNTNWFPELSDYVRTFADLKQGMLEYCTHVETLGLHLDEYADNGSSEELSKKVRGTIRDCHDWKLNTHAKLERIVPRDVLAKLKDDATLPHSYDYESIVIWHENARERVMNMYDAVFERRERIAEENILVDR